MLTKHPLQTLTQSLTVPKTIINQLNKYKIKRQKESEGILAETADTIVHFCKGLSEIFNSGLLILSFHFISCCYYITCNNS